MKIQFDYYDEAKERIKARYATTDDGKLWIGPFEEYFENGQLKRKGQYTDKPIGKNEPVFYNEEKRRVGDYIEYYEKLK